MPLAGYGDRGNRSATGTHDEIDVKAVALRVGDRTGVMVSADLLIIPREIADAATEQLAREAGLLREQIYFGATHTHASLGAWGDGIVGEAFAGKFQPGARTWIAGCIVRAVKEALNDLRPAAFCHGSFRAPELIRNRLVGQLGGVDPEFCFAILKQESWKTAVIGTYSAHATVLSSKLMEFSGDYPGAWQRAVEEATGGMAMFFAAGVGSHSPVPPKGGLEGAELMGKSLAGPIIERLARTPVTNVVAFGLLGTAVDLPEHHVRLSDGIRLRPWLASRLLNRTAPSFVQVLRIGDLVWVSTPCDFSGELANDFKDFMRARNFEATVTSFNGDYIGYVIPSRYYHLAGYEPRLMSFYGPTIPDYLNEIIRAMALQVTKQ
jgi:hypothetical protein